MKEKAYAPSVAVALAMLLIVHAVPPPVMVALANETGTPFRVSRKSLGSTPVTASLKVTSRETTEVFRGLGEIGASIAVGRVVSISHVRIAFVTTALPAESATSEPAALNVST